MYWVTSYHLMLSQFSCSSRCVHVLHSVVRTAGGGSVPSTPEIKQKKKKHFAAWRWTSAPRLPHVLFSWTFECFKSGPSVTIISVLKRSVKPQRQTWGRNSKSERPGRINSTTWLKKQVTRREVWDCSISRLLSHSLTLWEACWIRIFICQLSNNKHLVFFRLPLSFLLQTHPAQP